jgi:hypothetical protein
VRLLGKILRRWGLELKFLVQMDLPEPVTWPADGKKMRNQNRRKC